MFSVNCCYYYYTHTKTFLGKLPLLCLQKHLHCFPFFNQYIQNFTTMQTGADPSLPPRPPPPVFHSLCLERGWPFLCVASVPNSWRILPFSCPLLCLWLVWGNFFTVTRKTDGAFCPSVRQRKLGASGASGNSEEGLFPVPVESKKSIENQWTSGKLELGNKSFKWDTGRVTQLLIAYIHH